MRVRCPHCRKLYLVQYADVKEAKPRFECVQCHNRFWVPMADIDLSAEIQGIAMNQKERGARPSVKSTLKEPTEPCPKCFKSIPAGEPECPHCGVVVKKIRELGFIESAPAHSEQLGSAWKRVLSNYDDETLHSDFLRIAQRERNLPFAAAQYGQINKLMPGDETTMKRMTEVQALGEALLPPTEKTRPAPNYTKLWQIPLLAATIMILVGLALPMFRNIVGVGAAILFFAFAIQIQASRRN